ncbi:hypothetical protein NUW54_g1404 [Trametes sanguinea]|uniref:Uncharacterized protein n=1 Tax=Trametes sanguinea TaxID=158606 RepID=A0ACC1Q858_9APHY|nr:hypothetical protein NUW54_g1404 [Trametes sanguinea]
MKVTDTARSAPALVASSTLNAPALEIRSDSGGSSIFSTPQSTPIADFFRGRTTSIFCSDTSSDTSPSGNDVQRGVAQNGAREPARTGRRRHEAAFVVDRDDSEQERAASLHG